VNDTHRHECRCGKPIHDGAHLCVGCVARFRDDLTKIADRWPDLEAALTRAEIRMGDGSKPTKSTATGIALNEQVSRARRTCANALWFVVQVLRDDFDDNGWTFVGPRTEDVGQIARWVERWHVGHLTAKTAQETAEEIADDLAKAEKATWDALDPTRWVDVNLGCDDHATTEQGERVPCEGQMRARVGRGSLPDLVCSLDPTHRVAPAQWERSQWRRTKKLDDEGMRALVRRIVS
jgi:hypothetical protein